MYSSGGVDVLEDLDLRMLSNFELGIDRLQHNEYNSTCWSQCFLLLRLERGH